MSALTLNERGHLNTVRALWVGVLLGIFTPLIPLGIWVTLFAFGHKIPDFGDTKFLYAKVRRVAGWLTVLYLLIAFMKPISGAIAALLSSAVVIWVIATAFRHLFFIIKSAKEIN